MKVQTQADLERIIKRYRKRLSVDQTYLVTVEIVPEKKVSKHFQDADAWVEESTSHPIYSIKVRKSIVDRYADQPRCMIRLLVHELLHIVVGDSFKDLKKNYDYDKDGTIEETLVMRLAKAIVPLGNEDLYNEAEN